MIGKLCKVNSYTTSSPTTALWAAQGKFGLGIIIKINPMKSAPKYFNYIIFFPKLKETMEMPDYWVDIL